MKRLYILLSVGVALFAFLQSETASQVKQPPKKDVIPHGQATPPGPALSPQEALKKMTVPPGFHVELVAAEPDIVNPVAMTFDERGRIWITESIEYPKKAAGPGKDRVKVLESTKGDGKFDKVTTVIEGLNIPSGIAIGHGGVWLANAPDILYYPFEDFASAKLGKPQVVVTGFGRFDTHELPNSLTWGPDGFLYGLNGVFNRSVVKQDGKTFDFTCALFRIHPKTKKFELFCEGTSNPWGLAFNDNGDAFVSACVIDHLWHLTETGYYHRQGGAYPPYTWKIGSIVKHKHQKAAYCGLVWFDSDAYPPEYREKMYMGNIHGNAINCDQLERDGSTYFAKPGLLPALPEKGKGVGAFPPSPPVLRGRGVGGEGGERATASLSIGFPNTIALPSASAPSPLTPLPQSTGREGDRVAQRAGGEGKPWGVGPGSNFLLANDAWFMPVAQKVGPDGCLYILDWYDRYHCYQDANRDPAGIDRLKGRLYRVVYGDYKAAGKLNFHNENTDRLIARLHSPNVYFRDVAQRLLNQRLAELRFDVHQVMRHLEQLVLDPSAPRKARMHALWALLGERTPDTIFHLELLGNADATYRAWGVRAFGNYRTSDPRVRAKVVTLAKDRSTDVQLQVAIAAPKLKIYDVEPLPVLLDVLAHCGDDKLIPHIVWQNLHPLLEKDGERFLTLAAKVDLAKAPGVAKLLPRAIDRILGNPKGDPSAVVGFIDKLSTKDPNSATAKLCVTGLTVKVQNGEIAGKQLDEFKKTLTPLLDKLLDDENRQPLRREASHLSVSLGNEKGTKLIWLAFVHSGNPSEQLLALDSLITGRYKDLHESVEQVISDSEHDGTDFRGKVLGKLGKVSDPWVAEKVLKYYPKFTADEQAKAIELLTQRANWSKTLFNQIAAKKISKDVVNVNQARRLLATKDKELVQLIEKHWGIPRDGRNPERERLVTQMKELYAKTPGDAKAGVPIFKKLCAQCHKMHGEGVEVGPDITSNGRADFDQLLSNIFDPSLVIGSGYQSVTVNTKQGQVINGLIVEDNAQRVVLKVQGGELKTVARKDVEEQFTSKLSMMPEDLEKQLRPQEIVDLLAYLSLDRPPDDPKARKIPGTPR